MDDALPRTDSRPFHNRCIHFVGIAGAGMSGLAHMLLDAGAIVSGSDSKTSSTTEKLTRAGATITLHDGSSLSREIDLLVRSAAVPDDHPEMLAAVSLGLPTLKYAQFLGQFMSHRRGLAVCGTHGKSTTTAMIALALTRAGLDPSFIVGGTVPQLGGGSHSGAGDVFVAEACEFDRSFHSLRPRIIVLTNIEADHLDCYGSLEAIIESFITFVRLLPEDGLLIANASDANVRKVIDAVSCRVLTFGLAQNADYSIAISTDCHGSRTQTAAGASCGLLTFGNTRVTLTPGVPGLHNLYNAAAAVAACLAVDADETKVLEALKDFSGVDRRLTAMGRVNDAIVIDDYAHHPTEVRATLAAIREKYQPTRLVCVFQPHQHSRTRLLFDEFAASFEQADEVILPDIYAVRDSAEDRAAVSSEMLARAVSQSGTRCEYVADIDAIAEHLRSTLKPGELVVTMGAGNIVELARSLVAPLGEARV